MPTLPGNGVTPTPLDAPANEIPPQVTGTPVVGQRLDTTTGTWANTPESFTYQWFRGVTAIAGATNQSYTLVTADIGSMISAGVQATNADGSDTAQSNGVGPVLAAPPTSVTAPVLSGTPEVGQTLSITPGTWTGNPTSYSYAWYSGATEILEAQGQTSYVIQDTDIGNGIAVMVTAISPSGSNSAGSNTLGPVTEPEPPPPDEIEEALAAFALFLQRFSFPAPRS